MGFALVVFDLDGTLLDSDEALIAPFLALGIPRAEVTFGHLLKDECARLDIEMEAYLEAYDPDVAHPYEGVESMLTQLGRWAVASNKVRSAGARELDRLGWKPELAMFADDFDGPKRLRPVLDALGAEARDVLFVGDTAHDRDCARDAGVDFAIAAWNPRAELDAGDIVLDAPGDLLRLL